MAGVNVPFLEVSMLEGKIRRILGLLNCMLTRYSNIFSMVSFEMLVKLTSFVELGLYPIIDRQAAADLQGFMVRPYFAFIKEGFLSEAQR